MRIPFLLLASAFLSAQAPASVQLKPFRVSPPATVVQGLGLSTVKVEYSRPAVKGRSIWGGLVPYGQVWRAGANSATVITFSDPVTVEGRPLPAGSYALFVIPGPERWTFAFNRKAAQWGAYAYAPGEDALRIEVAPQAIPHAEWLRFDLDPEGADVIRCALAWERRKAAFDVRMDVKGIYWKHLEETLAKADPGQWAPWYQAAAYCFQEGIHPERMQAWLGTSLKAQETWWNLELKAKLLHKAGQASEARSTLERALALSRGKTPAAYQEGLEGLLKEWAPAPR